MSTTVNDKKDEMLLHVSYIDTNSNSMKICDKTVSIPYSTPPEYLISAIKEAVCYKSYVKCIVIVSIINLKDLY